MVISRTRKVRAMCSLSSWVVGIFVIRTDPVMALPMVNTMVVARHRAQLIYSW